MNEEINNTQTPEAKAKRATTVANKRAAKAQARGYTLPLVLTCVVTKKSVKYTSESYISKTIAKYGSLENLLKNYTSREGKRVQSQAS
jgi:hypothetical protein